MSTRFFHWWRRFESSVGTWMLFRLVGVVHRLPIRAALALGRGLGWLVPRISRRHYRRICDCATQFYGQDADPRTVSRLAYAAYRNLGQSLIEFLRLPHMTTDAIRQWARLEGGEHVAEGLARGRGVVLVTAHLGNWELLSAVMGLSGFPTTDIANPQDDEALTALLNRIRVLHGLRLVSMQDIRACLRVLKNNECLAVFSDGNARVPGAFVNFFGRPAATYTGAAYFAHATGAPLLPLFIERLPDDTHVARIGPPIPQSRTGDKQRDLLITTMRLQRVIQDEIRRRPHEWYWLLNRWRTRPEDVPNPERIPMEHRDLTPAEAADALEFSLGWEADVTPERKPVS